MANKAKLSVRFYPRPKTKDAEWRISRFLIVVGYDKKRLSIPDGNWTPACARWEAWQQVDSNGFLKDEATASEEAKGLSESLQKVKEFYSTAIQMLIERGKWKDLTSRELIMFFMLHEIEIWSRIKANKTKGQGK